MKPACTLLCLDYTVLSKLLLHLKFSFRDGTVNPISAGLWGDVELVW